MMACMWEASPLYKVRCPADAFQHRHELRVTAPFGHEQNPHISHPVRCFCCVVQCAVGPPASSRPWRCRAKHSAPCPSGSPPSVLRSPTRKGRPSQNSPHLAAAHSQRGAAGVEGAPPGSWPACAKVSLGSTRIRRSLSECSLLSYRLSARLSAVLTNCCIELTGFQQGQCCIPVLPRLQLSCERLEHFDRPEQRLHCVTACDRRGLLREPLLV
jgi:hypothetical protein